MDRASLQVPAASSPEKSNCQRPPATEFARTQIGTAWVLAAHPGLDTEPVFSRLRLPTIDMHVRITTVYEVSANFGMCIYIYVQLWVETWNLWLFTSHK